jgi:hypothetical protein
VASTTAQTATSFPDIAVWKKDWDFPGDLDIFGEGVSLSPFDPIVFNGLNLNPSVMSFAEKSVLGASLEDSLGTGVAFQLPEKPFLSDSVLKVRCWILSEEKSSLKHHTIEGVQRLHKPLAGGVAVLLGGPGPI